ncbi:uncharacterized protein LOC130797203 [Amaranthus tricolor]|uniref:uncharacterized protein LOC130797203 n=1 Tax=Amaranthus tricolor TaxID=29722 RepID=UPI00258C010E|nr:uncharacterized protein LOC130797203 [Amaranthus tricolor]
MREEVISSGGTNNNLDPTPAASSVGASSPAVPPNFGGVDWSGHGPGSKTGSLSGAGTQPLWTSLSTSAGGSALGSSQPSCRPWERGDLLRRLATFKPGNWFGKPKAASSLACARRGWVNVGADKIDCESCGANLKYVAKAGWTSSEADGAAEEFSKQLDLGHKATCPWRGNSCPESLVQFPPTPPSALIGGYKDRCDGLLQFAALPVVAASAIEQMHASRGPQIDRFLANSLNFLIGEPSIKMENTSGVDSREEAYSLYSHAQKLIALCGWEPRWLPDIQDCEDHSAQSARNGYSVGPSMKCGHPNDAGPSRKAFSSTAKKDSCKNEAMGPESKCESRSPLLDCSLCGATVRIWDFITVSRPVRVSPNGIEIPETSKKMVLTRGVSAASGISGWVGTDCMEKEQTEYHDEAATIDEGKLTSNTVVDLNLTMAGGLSSGHAHVPEVSQHNRDADLGKDLMIGQPSNSEVGDRAASYESRGPSTRKRSLEEGGSAVDRPLLRMQQADSVEGTVVDRDGDEVDDGKQYLAGPSKRFRESDVFERCGSSFRRDSSGAGPSNSQGIEIEVDERRIDISHGNDQVLRFPARAATRDSTHASSVIAMDTICHSADDDSMESVENHPGDVDDINFPSVAMAKNADLIDTSDLNYSNQAQQSVCFQPASGQAGGEMGVSSTNDEEEVLNTDTVTAPARDGPSMGISGGSVGMGASHEAEIHGTDMFANRSDSGIGDVEPIAEVVENQGQTGEFAPEHGFGDDFVEGMDREDPHGDSQDVVSRSMGRADSGSKVVGSTKAESVESGEKNSEMQVLAQEASTHPSLSCNAIVYSGIEASKEEVSQGGKQSPADEGAYPESDYIMANGTGPPNGDSNFDGAEFDPIKHHNSFCPWVNGNVAAAGCSTGAGSSAAAVALCGWQLTLDALDNFQSFGHVPAQAVESESAASLYKDDHLTSSRKLLAHHSFSKSRGQS